MQDIMCVMMMVLKSKPTSQLLPPLLLNPRSANPCQCTRHPAARPQPIPQDWLEKLKSKKKGRQGKEAAAEDLPVSNANLYHGYRFDNLADYNAAQQNAMEVAANDAALTSPPAEYLSANTIQNSVGTMFAHHILEPTFAQHGMISSRIDPNLALPLRQAALVHSTAGGPSGFYSSDHAQPHHQYVNGDTDLPLQGSVLTHTQPRFFHGALTDGNDGLTGIAAPAAGESNTCCQPDPMHNCPCGNDCACVACSVHPNNDATRQHLLNGASHISQQNCLNGRQWNQAATDQANFASEHDQFTAETAAADSNALGMSTFNTGDYNMFEAHFSQAEIEATYRQPMQPLNSNPYEQIFSHQ